MAGERERASAAPWVLVVMGVSGCGKSTVGRSVAERIGCTFLEGDAFHAPASIAKMSAGIALDDQDRFPWLDRLGQAGGEAAMRDGRAVIACSALKRSYRDRIRAQAGCRVMFALLDVDAVELGRRMAARPGHFMPASLLESQLATLEPPTPDENARHFAPGSALSEQAERVLAWVRDQEMSPTGL